jgi:hypothetical protein
MPQGGSGEIPWRSLADEEFTARALPTVETWLAGRQVEQRLLVVLDDELHLRLTHQRARRRRSGIGAQAVDVDLRPLCYLLLMAFDRACEGGGGGMLITRALRLAGLQALFCLLVAEPIAAPTWSHAHRMYARAENAADTMLVNDLGTSNDTLYLRMLLLSTIAGIGMSPRQIDKCFDWIEEWARGIALERERDPAQHYFAVDIDGSAGLVPAAGATLAKPRYFAHVRLAERVSASRSDYFRQISVATLGMYQSNPLFEYHDALHQLSRYWEYISVRQAGRDTGRQRVDGVQVAAEAGFDACCHALSAGKASMRWVLIDQSPSGAGFKVVGPPLIIEKGALTVFADPDSHAWVLGSAVRVVSTAQGGEIGVKRLADSWRKVVLGEEMPEGKSMPAGTGVPGFFVFGDEARGLSDSVLLKSGTFDPNRTYTMQPGADVFRIRLSRVIQSAGDWERVGFDVVKRLRAQA